MSEMAGLPGEIPAATEPPVRVTFWPRLAAWLIDVFLVGAVAVGIGNLAIALGTTEEQGGVVALLSAIVLWVANTTFLVGRTKGRSIGKLIGGMRLVHTSGAPVGYSIGFRRDTLLRLLYVIPLFFLLDGLFAARKERQTIRDQITDTVVVREQGYTARRGLAVMAAIVSVLAFSLATAASPDSWGDSFDDESTSDDYGVGERLHFVKECGTSIGVDAKSCGCVYDFMESRVAYKQFQAAVYEDLGSPTAQTEKVFDRAMDHCL